MFGGYHVVYTLLRQDCTIISASTDGKTTLSGLGCSLIQREGQRFFSSLVNEPHPSQWAATDGARSAIMPMSGGRRPAAPTAQ